MRIDATGRERLPVGDDLVDLVGWLPDARGIAFVSERNGVRTMSAIQVEQGRGRGDPVTLLRGVGRNRALGITSGGALTYAVDGQVMNSYIADLRENPPLRTAIGASDREWTLFPSWSPDGRHLAFAVRLPFIPDGSPVRLMTRDLSTGQDRLLLEWNGTINRGGSWTAHGASYVVARRIGRSTFGAGTFRIDRVLLTSDLSASV